ncbi:MAG: poly-beta-1,6 N-acetyl-D-glucosamine synthase [Hydrogenophilaceae bacterium]|nr:poly-beta-1,6 N-acetyl-D-glucosamine synthase [Hydrogenophilaceae bacterium]
MDIISALDFIQHSILYKAAIVFFAAYPIITSIMWMTTSLFFRGRWEKTRREGIPESATYRPFVSILIPAHNEEKVLDRALTAATQIEYPKFEVVVVDDGSTDGTGQIIESFTQGNKVRAVYKQQNQGKALALNDAIPLLNGEIVLIMDADAEPAPDVLDYIVPHFASARVAAVTGNPRVRNVDNFLSRLQLIEFTSIVSVLRRSQRIWGRIVTVSGVVAAFRKTALLDVGGFSPDMPTEDIELTWKLQKRFWDVRYEPKALVWMTVPSTYKTHFRQRLRWARGLMQVLRRHRDVAFKWKLRRMWPIFSESVLSILWAVCFVLLTTIWAVSYAVGYPPIGAHPIPNFWGMVIATTCLSQLLVGTWLDRRYDPETPWFFPYAVYYPIVYWMILSITTFLALPYLFKKPSGRAVTWKTLHAGSQS